MHKMPNNVSCEFWPLDVGPFQNCRQKSHWSRRDGGHRRLRPLPAERLVERGRPREMARLRGTPGEWVARRRSCRCLTGPEIGPRDQFLDQRSRDSALFGYLASGRPDARGTTESAATLLRLSMAPKSEFIPSATRFTCPGRARHERVRAWPPSASPARVGQGMRGLGHGRHPLHLPE